MKDFIKKHKFGIIAISISMIAAFIFCLAKRSLFTDEAITFTLANYNTGFLTYDTHGWYERDMWDAFTVRENAFNYSQVWWNQYFDVHPPLYYYLLKTICSFFPYRFSIWFGLIINALFFFLDLVLIYTIVNRFTKNDLISALAVLLLGLNGQMLSYVIFIRMYMMSSFFVLLFIYVATRIIFKDGNKYLNIIFLFLSVILGGLTHYQFYMLIASISLFIAIYLAIKKRWFDLISSFISVLLAGLLNVFVLFNGTLYHLSFGKNDSVDGGRHVGQALDSLKNLGVDFSRLEYFLSHSWGGYLEVIISILLLIILIVLVISKKRKKEADNNIYPYLLVLEASYLLGFWIIIKTSTYISTRYVVPTIPLGVLANFLGIYFILKDKLSQKIICVIIIIMIALNIDFSTVIKNIGTEASWDFAKKHQDDIAYVLTEDDNEGLFNSINVLFTNLRWYIATGMNQMDKELGFDDSRNIVLYISNKLDKDEALAYISTQYEGDKELQIVKQDIVDDYYDIYTITFDN